MTYDELMAHAADLAADDAIEAAAAAYREAAMRFPDHPGPLYELGLLSHAQGQPAEAVVCFERAAALVPGDASVWNNLAVAHYSAESYDKAERAFRQAIACDPRYADAWYGLGRLMERAGRMVECELAYKTSLRGNPHHPRARARLDALTAAAHPPSLPRLRIGFVTIWFERGQAYVTKTLRDALAAEHDTFILARTGGVYGQPMLETSGFWQVPNLRTHDTYRIPPDLLVAWIREHRLDAVIFNEEYDWNLVSAARSTGARVLTYLDYYKETWKPLMRLYDGVLCSTLRTYHLVSPHCEAYYTGWAVDTDLFKPLDAGVRRHTFFHNAGWLGIGYRKMTPAVIAAFDAIGNELPEATLLVHAQVGVDMLPPDVAEIVARNPRITYHVGTEPAPGLYHRGQILVFPSKLEGLGLPLLEGLASGLPAIATDAPPMNEFVLDGYNGLLVSVEQTVAREDDIAFPETLVSVSDLAAKMRALAGDPVLAAEMGANARRFAVEHLSMEGLRRQLGHALQRTVVDRRDGAPASACGAPRPTTRGEARSTARNAAPSDMIVHLVGAQETNSPWGFENRLIPALQEIGCRVVSTDYRKHRHEIADLLRQPADLVLVCHGEGIPPEAIRSAPCPTVLWYAEQIGTPDAADEPALMRRRALAYNIGAYHVVLSHDEGNLEVHRRLGAHRVDWLPTAAVDPGIHRRLDLPKIYDVTFVGSLTPRRARILESLSRSVVVHVENVWDPTALNRLYNQSRIVLNLHLSDLPNTETRVAEVLGAGAFLLTERLSSPHFLTDGEHYASFPSGDVAALVDLVRHYLAHDRACDVIAAQGHAAIVRDHTYADRMRQLLRLVLGTELATDGPRAPTERALPPTTPNRWQSAAGAEVALQDVRRTP